MLGAFISLLPDSPTLNPTQTGGNSNVFYQGGLPYQPKGPGVSYPREFGAVANWRLHILAEGLTLLKNNMRVKQNTSAGQIWAGNSLSVIGALTKQLMLTEVERE